MKHEWCTKTNFCRLFFYYTLHSLIFHLCVFKITCTVLFLQYRVLPQVSRYTKYVAGRKIYIPRFRKIIYYYSSLSDYAFSSKKLSLYNSFFCLNRAYFTYYFLVVADTAQISAREYLREFSSVFFPHRTSSLLYCTIPRIRFPRVSRVHARVYDHSISFPAELFKTHRARYIDTREKHSRALSHAQEVGRRLCSEIVSTGK